ncbi:MAG: DUF1641 domain-containing protein [Acidimicrobiia bacterium]|nr:DUF1641 domain-containing protein [Acidimicrobiia bacterium]
MTTALDTDRMAQLEAKIDQLTDQVAFLADQAREQAQRREMQQELISDLSPIAAQAIHTLTRELATTDLDMVTVIRLLKRFAESAETLDAALEQLQSAHGLIDDIMPLTGDAFMTATQRLAELEQRGYFSFAREGLGVLDRVVTTYDEEDIRALGDNIVLILDTVKQMTQPEVMTMLRRTVDSIEETDVESASLFTLARQMRDPEVKRGLARMLGMLRTVGADPTDPPTKTN